MADGVKQPTEEGTPQGSPLSPLLSNVYLDDLDQVLQKRGHRFVRYADDLTIYVRSERAAERVMASTCEFIERRLRLKVNRRKFAVDRAERRPLLGFGFFRRGGEVKVRIDPKARKLGQGPPSPPHRPHLSRPDVGQSAKASVVVAVARRAGVGEVVGDQVSQLGLVRHCVQ